MTEGTVEAERAAEWRGSAVDRWRDRWGAPLLHVYDRVGSTNDAARALAQQGAPQGAVVLARHQFAGRGRRGRAWTAPADSSLLLSMVLRPAAAGAESVLSIRLGMAAARAIERVTGLTIGLKWPNDLLVEGRKVAGILCEGALEGTRPLYVIAGIGINLTQQDDDWPPDLAGTATSLDAARRVVAPADRADRAVDPADLAGRLVARWLAAAAEDARALAPAEVREIRRRDALRGRPVSVDDSPAGVARGIAADGALLVERDGATRRIVAGTVRATDDHNDTDGDPR